MRSNPIRFTGMASGMDTDSIVRDLMRPQQYKVDQEKKAQALVKLKQDAWKDMNKRLYDFHRNFTHKLSLGSTYDKNITTSNNPDAIEILNGERVPEGTHKINVTQLATSTFMAGQIDVGALTLGDSTTVANLTGSTAEKIKITMKVNREGEEIEVSVRVGSNDTLATVAKKITEGLKDDGFTARYDATNKSFFVTSNKTGAGQTIKFESAYGVEDIESAEGVMEEVQGADIPLLSKLGLDNPAKYEVGQPAKYKYNDIDAEFTSDSNQIQVNGIQATLKAEGVSIISTVADPDATYDFIKEFVTEYNNLIDEINLKLGTRPAKDIMPLTSEEREVMSDSEIKLWEDKLNSSLFYKDAQLTEFVDNARSILSNQFGGDLAALGIVTGPWAERGKLHILGDEDDALYSDRPNKLREALSENPQAVADKFEEIGKKLYTETNAKLIKGSTLKSAMNFFNDKVMDDQVKSFDKRILTLEERMYKMEEMQYRKFAAMEKMLSSLNNQGSWLAQQFGGM